MASKTKAADKKKAMPRASARIFQHQADFIKAEARKSKGEFTEGDVHRQLLEEAIISRKEKEDANK